MTIRKRGRRENIALGDFEDSSAAAQLSRIIPLKWIAYLQIIRITEARTCVLLNIPLCINKSIYLEFKPWG